MTLCLGQRVRVYRNLRSRCWSVMDAATRRVVGHLDELCLDRTLFRVSTAGRDRVVREHRKNVHAFVEGRLLIREGRRMFDSEQRWWRVSYDPYYAPFFYVVRQLDRGREYADKYPLSNADVVAFDADGSCWMEVTP